MFAGEGGKSFGLDVRSTHLSVERQVTGFSIITIFVRGRKSEVKNSNSETYKITLGGVSFIIILGWI